MTTPSPKLLLVIVLGLAFNFLFWEESQGINLVLFSGLFVVLAILLNPSAVKNKFLYIVSAGLIASGLSVVVFNSSISIFTHWACIFLFAAFVHRHEIRSIVYAVLEMLMATHSVFLKLGGAVNQVFSTVKINNRAVSKITSYLKLAIIPVGIFFIFFVIFSIANPIFSGLAEDTISFFRDGLADLLSSFSFVRLPFLLLGLYIAALLLVGGKNIYDLNEQKKVDELIRTKTKSIQHSNPIALKNEYKIALMVVIPVNLLFLLVNVIDIKWLWLSGIPDSSDSWSKLVHEGTYMLITSILLSMLILLYFFNKNLNFYKNNSLLKKASYVWLVQNVILAISVALRSYYYIQVHGLAYKRIGVLIFLLLAVIGLATFFIKIKDLKSIYFLVRVNSWAAFIVLITMSAINWDVWIVEHNFNHVRLNDGEIDIDYLISRADRTLPLVDQYKDRVNMSQDFNRQYRGNVSMNYGDSRSRKDYFNKRKRRFIIAYEKTTWLSWNLADQKTYSYFKPSDE